jgi:hypothetical protein
VVGGIGEGGAGQADDDEVREQPLTLSGSNPTERPRIA